MSREEDYYNDPYHAPKKFGLDLIGEVQWGEADYSFDLTVVWRDPDGNYYYADDSGCSCPSPFEEYRSLDQLTKATRHEVLAHLTERREERYSNPDDGMNLTEKLAALQ